MGDISTGGRLAGLPPTATKAGDVEETPPSAPMTDAAIDREADAALAASRYVAPSRSLADVIRGDDQRSLAGFDKDKRLRAIGTAGLLVKATGSDQAIETTLSDATRDADPEVSTAAHAELKAR